jgi:tetratricopeptide (TPR) repeat protein
MVQLSARYKVWIACIFCLLVGAFISWMVQQSTRVNPGSSALAEEASAAEPVDAAEVLAAIPKVKAKERTAVDQVIAQAREKAEENSDDPRIWALLGDALMQKARETADAGYYGHAERAYRRALMLDERQVEAITGLAWVCSGRHEFEQSIVWANKAIALDPRNHLAYGLLGDAAVEMGDYDTAFEHYQKMLDLHPDISSYSRGAHLLYLTGDLRKARWLMQKALQAGAPYAENTLWCRAQLAQIYLSDGNLLAAEQLLQEARDKMPKNYHLLAASGRVRTARKDYRGAIASYQQAAAIAPQHDVLVALGDLYRQIGDMAEADKQYALVESVHRANKANGVRGDAQLAQFYADHDRNLAEALALAEEEYKTRKNVFVADTLAWCYYKNGRYREAKRAIGKALRKHTPEALFLFHAGTIDAKLGDTVSAQRQLYQALSLNPNFSLVYAPIAVDMLHQSGARQPAAPPPAKERQP